MPQSAKKATTTEFSSRLSQAISNRGLTLNRLQAHLAGRGLRVSAATLSYWSNGRSVPARTTSIPVITELEHILDVPAGHLTNALSEPSPLQLSMEEDRERRLRTLIAAADMPNPYGQELVAIHLEVVVGADRSQRSSTTTVVVQCRTTEAKGWSMTIDADQGQHVTAEALRGLALGRVLELDERATLFEMLYEPPLRHGECRRTQHRLTYTPAQEPCVMTGYALGRPTTVLIMGVSFEGEVPRSMERCLRRPGRSSEMESKELLVPAQDVEVVLTSPPVGLHALRWEW